MRLQSNKILAAVTLLLHLVTFPTPKIFAADGWIVTDAQGNTISQTDGGITTVNAIDGNSYQVLNGDIPLDQILNINILNNQGVVDTAAKAIFNIADGQTSEWSGTLNLTGIAAFLNAYGFNIHESFQGNIQGGAVLSTLGINQEQFFAGMAALARSLDQDPAAILNKGSFSVAENSFLALVAGAVANQGNIQASRGAVILAAGDKVSLDITGGSGLISVAVEKSVEAAVFDSSGNQISDAISNTGTIQANGGIAILTAKASEQVFDNVINHSGIIEANTLAEKNGQIILDGGDEGVVSVTGTLNSKGDNVGEEGGILHVLGDKVGLFGGATLDASGYNGGGTILIGGDYQGLGSARNAFATYIDSFAVVKADALLEGNGGKIIVWAEESTRAHGILSAHGGELSGDGGLIETSGKNFLAVDGISVDASAPQGQSGTWLLDPRNVTISTNATSNGSFDTASPNVFTPTGNSAVVNVDDINSRLDAGTSVSITTGSTGSQNGDVTLDSAAGISKSSGSNTVTFTITAARDILLNGTIGATVGILNMVLSGRDIKFSNTVDTHGGSITATSTRHVQLNDNDADITTSGGGFTITADSDLSSSGDYDQSASGSSVSTSGGAIDITGDGFNLDGTVNSGTGTVEMTATGGNISISNTITTSNAAVTLEATGNVALDNVSSDIATSGGSYTVRANTDGNSSGDYNQSDSGSAVSTSGGNISLTGEDFTLSGTHNAGAGSVTLLVARSGRTIRLGSDSANITISGAELQNITAQNLTIGSSLNGDISVRGITADNSNNISGTVTLNATDASGDVTFQTTASTFNAITVNAGSNINVDVNLTTDAGATVLNADSDSSGSGTVTIGSSAILDTGDQNITVGGSSFDLQGSMDAGTGTIFFQPVAGTTVGLGSSSGSYSISDAEADLMTAGALEVGTAASGNIFIDSFTPANINTITLRTNGSVSEGSADASSDLTAATLTIESATGIDLDILSTTLTAAVSGTGLIDIKDTSGGLAVTSATTADGAITLNATGGNLNLTTVTAAGTSRNINLSTTTSGDVNVGSVTASSDDITVTSAGAIEESGADAGADLTSATMSLSAAAGIGASGTLELDATTLTSAAVSGTGLIDIKDTSGGLAVTSATTADGAITLNTTGGNLNLTTVTAAGTSRNINLSTTTSGDVNVGSVTAAADTVTAASAGAINESGSDASADISAGSINLTANSGGIGTSGNPLEVTATVNFDATTTADNGNIFVGSAGDFPVGAVNAGTGNIVFTSSGNVTDTNDNAFGEFSAATVNITAGGFELDSTSGIGTSTDALEMQLHDFGAAAGDGRFIADGGSGGIFVTNRATSGFGLTLNTVTGGLLSSVTADSNITLFSGSPLTVAVNVTSGSNITLSALGAAAADDLTLNSGITISSTNSGTILLTAGDTISLAAGAVVSSIDSSLLEGLGAVTLASGEDYTDTTLDQDGNTGISGGDVLMTETSRIESESGDILIDAADDFFVGFVDADSNNNGANFPPILRGNVTAFSRAGDTLDGNDAGALDFRAQELTMVSGGSIGETSNPLETDLPFFKATAGSVAIESLSNTEVQIDASDSVTFTSRGDMTLNRISSSNGGVTLNASGSILSKGGSDTRVSANSFIELNAGNTVGTSSNAIHTSLLNPGSVFIRAGGSDNGVSANVTGNFSPLSVEFLNTPPGLALFNGVIRGGGSVESLSTALSGLFGVLLPRSSQFGQFDGNYLADFPGVFNLDHFGRVEAPVIDVSGLDISPLLPGEEKAPPPVVPLPRAAERTEGEITDQDADQARTIAGV